MIDYIRDGQEIYRQSFATIRAEADLSAIPADLEKLAVRLIHACGMVDVVQDLRFSPGAGAAAPAAQQRRKAPLPARPAASADPPRAGEALPGPENRRDLKRQQLRLEAYPWVRNAVLSPHQLQFVAGAGLGFQQHLMHGCSGEFEGLHPAVAEQHTRQEQA